MKDGRRKRGVGAFPGREPARGGKPDVLPARPVEPAARVPEPVLATPLVPGAPRGAARADKTNILPFRDRAMSQRPMSLEKLYARFDALAEGRDVADRGWSVHEAILDRLAANMREATDRGWTSCALERAGGMGRLRAFGVQPSEPHRRVIPDWKYEPRS